MRYAPLQRPEVFKINTKHPLAQGLIFAGFGHSPGSALYVDSGPAMMHGVLNTMTPVTDWVWAPEIGQFVLEFDGSDDYVSITDNPLLDISGNKTLCCWVKMPTVSNGCGFTGKSNSTYNGMALGYGWNTNGFMALCWNSTNNPWIARDATRDYEWCHLSAVQHGSTRYIYVWDKLGLRTSSYSSGGTHTWDNILPLRIGDAGSQKPPNGTKIGSVQVYNRALSGYEVQQLANPYDPMLNGLLEYPKRQSFLMYQTNNIVPYKKHVRFKSNIGRIVVSSYF